MDNEPEMQTELALIRRKTAEAELHRMNLIAKMVTTARQLGLAVSTVTKDELTANYVADVLQAVVDRRHRDEKELQRVMLDRNSMIEKNDEDECEAEQLRMKVSSLDSEIKTAERKVSDSVKETTTLEQRIHECGNRRTLARQQEIRMSAELIDLKAKEADENKCLEERQRQTAEEISELQEQLRSTLTICADLKADMKRLDGEKYHFNEFVRGSGGCDSSDSAKQLIKKNVCELHRATNSVAQLIDENGNLIDQSKALDYQLDQVNRDIQFAAANLEKLSDTAAQLSIHSGVIWRQSQSECHKLQEELNRERRATSALESERQQKIHQLETQLKVIRGTLEETNSQIQLKLNKSSDEVTVKEHNLTELKEKLKCHSNNLINLHKQKNERNEEKEELSRELLAVRQNIAILRTRLGSAESDLKETRRQLNWEETNRCERQSRWSDQINRWREDVESHSRQLEKLQQDSSEQKDKIDRIIIGIETVKLRLNDIRDHSDQLIRESVELEMGNRRVEDRTMELRAIQGCLIGQKAREERQKHLQPDHDQIA